MKNNTVPLIPVWRPNTEVFLDSFPLSIRRLGHGISIGTRPLLVNKAIDLLGVSMDDQALCSGLIDQTDRILDDIEIETLIFSNRDVTEFLIYNILDFQEVVFKSHERPGAREELVEMIFWQDLDGRRRQSPLIVTGVVDKELGRIYLNVPEIPLFYIGKELFLRAFTINAKRGNAKS